MEKIYHIEVRDNETREYQLAESFYTFEEALAIGDLWNLRGHNVRIVSEGETLWEERGFNNAR